MFQPQYFNVHWYGPHSFDDAEVLDDQNLVLYMVCGTHGIYGKSVPLYIGKTFRTPSKRLGEHKWIEHELRNLARLQMFAAKMKNASNSTHFQGMTKLK